MEAVKNFIKSGYFQIINFLQGMETIWFVTIWLALLAFTFLCVLKFYKSFNNPEKDAVKVSMIVIAILLFACLVFLTYIRK